MKRQIGLPIGFQIRPGVGPGPLLPLFHRPSGAPQSAAQERPGWCCGSECCSASPISGSSWSGLEHEAGQQGWCGCPMRLW